MVLYQPRTHVTDETGQDAGGVTTNILIEVGNEIFFLVAPEEPPLTMIVFSCSDVGHCGWTSLYGSPYWTVCAAISWGRRR